MKRTMIACGIGVILLTGLMMQTVSAGQGDVIVQIDFDEAERKGLSRLRG